MRDHQVGDIHVTYKDDVYLIWKLCNERSRVWMPIIDFRSLETVELFVSFYRKFADSDSQYPSVCGFYRAIESEVES